jgi:hypothetical protein
MTTIANEARQVNGPARTELPAASGAAREKAEGRQESQVPLSAANPFGPLPIE